MRGVNETTVGGNVGEPIKYGETGKEERVCSFMLASEKSGDVTWIRVNVFNDHLVMVCEKKLVRGVYVVVVGELMNRDFRVKGEKTSVTEVRAKDLIFT